MSMKTKTDGPTPKQVAAIALAVLILVLLIATALSITTTVSPGQVAVIKNNITGAEAVQLSEGIIIHLPFGLTDVYVLDKTQKSLIMADEESVIIKTREGANVDTNVEITYSLNPVEASKIVKEIGMGSRGADITKVNDLVVSFVRSKVRDEIGRLNLDELARPEERTARIEDTRRRLNDELAPFGIEIQTVSATDWDYDDKYEAMIKRRKEADQVFVNQAAAQETNRKKQETMVAEQDRLRSNAVAEAKGEVQKELITKEAWALEQRAGAEGLAYKMQKDADAAFIRLQNEAIGTELELTKRAEGIRALADAYAKGGISLVKEALSQKLKGVQITGRPFSLDSQPQRVQMEQVNPETLAPRGGVR